MAKSRKIPKKRTCRKRFIHIISLESFFVQQMAFEAFDIQRRNCIAQDAFREKFEVFRRYRF